MGDDPTWLQCAGNPSAIEKLVATTARQLAVPSQYRQLRNSLSSSSDNLHAGMGHFADHCATCHANDGSGDPHSAKVSTPNHRTCARRKHKTRAMESSITRLKTAFG